MGNTVLIVFVSFFGSRVHRPRCIGGGALLACLASLLMAMPHFVGGEYDYTDRISCKDSTFSSLQAAAVCCSGINVSVSQQPPVTTPQVSAPSLPPPPTRRARSRGAPPSRRCTLCCSWVSCCWGSEPFPSSPSASPTSTTTPAGRTLRFTWVGDRSSVHEL